MLQGPGRRRPEYLTNINGNLLRLSYYNRTVRAPEERMVHMIDLDCLEQVEGSNDQHDLVLFALSTCGWCRKSRNFLDENDISYRYVYVDLLEDGKLEEVLGEVEKRNPKKSFPTLVIDDEDVLVGFVEDRYKKRLTDGR